MLGSKPQVIDCLVAANLAYSGCSFCMHPVTPYAHDLGRSKQSSLF